MMKFLGKRITRQRSDSGGPPQGPLLGLIFVSYTIKFGIRISLKEELVGLKNLGVFPTDLGLLV